jgi:hypothetical protein
MDYGNKIMCINEVSSLMFQEEKNIDQLLIQKLICYFLSLNLFYTGNVGNELTLDSPERR